jgi:hypothetical protein
MKWFLPCAHWLIFTTAPNLDRQSQVVLCMPTHTPRYSASSLNQLKQNLFYGTWHCLLTFPLRLCSCAIGGRRDNPEDPPETSRCLQQDLCCRGPLSLSRALPRRRRWLSLLSSGGKRRRRASCTHRVPAQSRGTAGGEYCFPWKAVQPIFDSQMLFTIFEQLTPSLSIELLVGQRVKFVKICPERITVHPAHVRHVARADP